MEPKEKKTPGFSITAVVLFLVSLATPQIIAPLFLIVAIITGLIGWYRREWGGAVPLITAVLSIIVLYTVYQRINESFNKISHIQSSFGENDISYGRYVELLDMKVKITSENFFVNGRIKNNGTKTIKSCTIKLKEYDEYNNVVNTDTAYILGDIEPNESKAFQAMMHAAKSAQKYNFVFVEIIVAK